MSMLSLLKLLIKGLQEKMEAYQVLKAFAKNTYKLEIELLETTEEELYNDLPSWQMLWPDPIYAVTNTVALILTMPTMMPDQIEEESDERLQIVLNKIDQAEAQAKMFRLAPILNKFTQLTHNFKQQMKQCSRVKKDTDISHGIEHLYLKLEQAEKTLKKTGNLEQFRINVNKAFEIFPDDAKFEINGTRTWFQRHVIRPFEQFKFDAGVLFEDILNKISEHHKDSPRFFKKPVDNALETYQ